MIIISLILALGILGSGFFISKGFYESRSNKPYITVKGLAERQVKADLAVWNIPYTVIGNDITEVNNEYIRQQLLILNYLKEKGFKDNEISLNQMSLTDRYANDYGSNKPEQRYVIKGGIVIRSIRVEDVKLASQTTGELVKQGIALSGDDSTSNPAFYYTQLNTIRPSMLSEATKSARRVASQFADDSDSTLGMIRRANQGIFEINSPDATALADSDAWQMRRNEQASIYKKIRLVSTIDYFLDK